MKQPYVSTILGQDFTVPEQSLARENISAAKTVIYQVNGSPSASGDVVIGLQGGPTECNVSIGGTKIGYLVPMKSIKGSVLKCDSVGNILWARESGGTTYQAGEFISIQNDTISVTGMPIFEDYQIYQGEVNQFTLTADDIAASGHVIDFQFRDAPSTNTIMACASIQLEWYINYIQGAASSVIDKIYFILRNTQSGSYTWNCVTCSDVKDSQWDRDWNCFTGSAIRQKWNQLRVNISLKPEAQVGDQFQLIIGGFVKDLR